MFFSIFNLFLLVFASVFFFNDTATTEIYTLSLHDALPILPRDSPVSVSREPAAAERASAMPKSATTAWPSWNRMISGLMSRDRKSTRLNSSHSQISYAVFCLKKKKKKHTLQHHAQTQRQQH